MRACDVLGGRECEEAVREGGIGIGSEEVVDISGSVRSDG